MKDTDQKMKGPFYLIWGPVVVYLVFSRRQITTSVFSELHFFFVLVLFPSHEAKVKTS